MTQTVYSLPFIVSKGRLLCCCSLLMIGLFTASLQAQSRTPQTYTPKADAALREKIQTLYQKAKNLDLDGKAEDWDGFLELRDRSEDAGGDASRDLVSMAIAPMPHEIRVMLRTRGKPSTDAFAFYVWLDVQGSYDSDVVIDYQRVDGALAMRYVMINDKGERSLSDVRMLRNSRVEIDDVVEFVIRYEDLLRAMPEEWRKGFADPNLRPWVRAWSYAYKRFGDEGRYVDRGPVVASYRLQRQAYRLDARISHSGMNSQVVVGLPLRGLWFVNQGPYTQRTHKRQWAYDFIMVDQGLRPAVLKNGKGPADPQKYFGWNQPVIAPVDARVIQTKDGNQDHQVTGNFTMSAGNSVFLALDSELGLYMDHLKLDSVAVRNRQQVSAGDELGRIGNSGMSLGPHLHLAALNRKDTRLSYPIALLNVQVGLNPVANDPWVRNVTRWSTREGYFVRRLKKSETTLD